MKIRILPKPKQLGSTLLTTLFICSLLGLSTMGYLSLVEYQNRMSFRSQSWNLTMSLVEAGIEEGLSHLNVNYNKLDVDGWAISGNNQYIRSRSLSSGSYDVTINASSIQYPEVTSRATVNITPLAQSRRSWFFAVANANTSTTDSTTVSRLVRVKTYKGHMITKALVAKNTIDMNGNNVRVDSFDSTDPLYHTNGRYDSTKIKAKGDVASNTNIDNAVSVGNANVFGHVSTGPGGTVYVGQNGAVGDVAWHQSNTGIQPTWTSDDSNFTFPDSSLPYSSGFDPAPGSIVTISSVLTNLIATNSIYYPSPAPPTGVVTNTTYITNSTIPNTIPAGFQTNTATMTAVSLPSPLPSGTITTNTSPFTGAFPSPGSYVGNITTNTTSTTSKTFPAPGTYLGSVSTNVVTNGPQAGRGTWYTFNLKNGTYTYQKISSYVYGVVNYRYPTYSYTYSLVSTTTMYETNDYDHVIYSGDYYADSLSGSTIVVGNARLVLPNGLSMSGNQQLTIANNGSIEVYSGGAIDLGGNGVINQSGLAQNFILFCTPSVTSVSIGGNGEFTGVLVAPSAHLHLHGGGNNSTRDFTGAALVKSAQLNGHFNIHYDEALSKLPATGRYLITQWDEMSD